MPSIIHIMHSDKFIGPFIELIQDNFNFKNHFFIIIGREIKNYGIIPSYDNVIKLTNRKEYTFGIVNYFKILSKFTANADKIILHGLFRSPIITYFFLNKELLPKCYWLPWGADLYFSDLKKNSIKALILNFMRKKIYKDVGYIVTGTYGDYLIAQKNFGATGQLIHCFTYPSNVFRYVRTLPVQHDTINIIVGNSRDPSNNHVEILNMLYKYKENKIKIYVPLSYGPDLNYSKRVINTGKKLFGNKFKAVTNFVPYNDYLSLLSRMDIGIFNHSRQQAFSNIITLLGMGKKVYINKESTLNGVFEKYQIKVFNNESIDLDPIDQNIISTNIIQVEKYFSEDALIDSLNKWLN